MKQLIQNLKTGESSLIVVPDPICQPGKIKIQSNVSLVSLGTERMLVDFGKSNYLQKAKQQPEKVKQVLEKVKTEGLKTTINAVQNKLNQPLPLGYCNVGKIFDIGTFCTEFKKGDRVASNGNHAEFVLASENLCARIPDNVSDEEATFTVIGAIGLQGIRLMQPTFGETVVVVGLGLIGLITVQLLLSNGCNVIGIDLDDSKTSLAKEFGAQVINPQKTNPVAYIDDLSNNIGIDGVIITASSKSNVIISQAAQMCRKHGCIVLVGVIGLDINRSDFYEKELSFQVSCSYGPGRYDPQYEDQNIDYPIGYVRWTEKRNFEAVLDAISTGRLNVKPLISEIVLFEEFDKIYGNMSRPGIIGSLLKYNSKPVSKNIIRTSNKEFRPTKPIIGIIGAGNFTSATTIPSLQINNAQIKTISSAGGLTATNLAKKAGIPNVTTDYFEILNDDEITTVLINTRHDLHFQMIIDCLKANKNILVEKPMALSLEEIDNIREVYNESKSSLKVGFNRRFSPFSKKIKSLLSEGPCNIVATMNAGFIPPNTWVQDLEIGGGRIIGEACHLIDLITFLTGSLVTSVCMNALGRNPDMGTDNATLLLKCEDGSNVTINYFANGAKSYPKEKVEIFQQGRILSLDNWRLLKGYGFSNFKKMKSKIDKGHLEMYRQLLESTRNGIDEIIPFTESMNTTLTTFAAIKSLQNTSWINVNGLL